MTVATVREPLYRTAPDCRMSFGDLAARVGTDLGLPPDVEQQAALDAIFAEKEPGVPASRHACIVGPRQNIKTSTLVIAALTDLFVLGVPEAIWTAHQSKTSTKSYEDMSARIRAHPEYAKLADFRSGRGEELIFLPGTNISLEFRARSGGSGRGFTTDRLTLDEALYLRAGDMGALLPTMLTRKGAQVRYGSSAGLRISEVLRGLRDRGRAGTDPRLFYVEYGARFKPCEQAGCSHVFGVEGCALDDRDLWWQGNSALWCGRIEEDNVADLRRSLPPDEFAREVLVWWEDPPAGGGAIDSDRWAELADPQADRGTPTFGLDMDLDRRVRVGVAWQRPDGGAQVMLSPDDLDLPAHKAAARCRELIKAWGGKVWIGGAAASLADDLEREHVPYEIVKGNDFPTACGYVMDGLDDRTLHHGNQAELSVSAAGVLWRAKGTAGEREFDLKGSANVGPLAAVTRALYGLITSSGSSVYEDRGFVTL